MKKLNLIIACFCIVALAVLQGCSDTKADEKDYSRIQLIEYKGDYRIIRVDSVEFITNVCLSYRHDYGLLNEEEKKKVEFECKEWMRAIVNNYGYAKYNSGGSVCGECGDGSGWYGDEDITYNCSKCNPCAI